MCVCSALKIGCKVTTIRLNMLPSVVLILGLLLFKTGI